jgi:nucleotide-binding universal stress UspA family protein
MLNNILIPIDDSKCSEQAAHYGFALAKHFKARVVIVHVVEELPQLYRETAWFESLLKQGTDLINSWKHKAQNENLTVQASVIKGEDVAQSVVTAAQENNCDLILMGTHGRKGLAHAFLGSVAERVTRLSDIPIMLIRDQGTVPEIKRIVLAIDGSVTSRKALSYADNLAQKANAELHLLHVIPDLPPPIFDPLGVGGMVSGLTYDSMLKNLEQEARIVMEVARAEIKTENPIFHTARAQRERTSDVITQYAKEQQCDLIVMGTHGRTGLNHILLGSVAQGVTHQATCPLLLIHHAEA